MKKIKWPENKKFAFTVIDDTDAGTVENLKPVYDYLYKKGIRTTKTIWTYPARDYFMGQSLSEKEYYDFICELNSRGFEIASHGPGSGIFEREEIIESFQTIKTLTGKHPTMHINHGNNPDAIYWGAKRFVFPFNKINSFIKEYLGHIPVASFGDDPQSKHFWGDYAKNNIKYIRNKVYSGINTIDIDKQMPYREKKKDKYSNYWFSSSDGYNCDTFVRLLSDNNIHKLVDEGGCSIIYTHFGYGFLDANGNLRKDFKQAISKIAKCNGYFAPASDILDIIKNQRNQSAFVSNLYLFQMDAKWLLQRLYRRLKWRI